LHLALQYPCCGFAGIFLLTVCLIRRKGLGGVYDDSSSHIDYKSVFDCLLECRLWAEQVQ
jgi:hypothetical protein